MRLHEAIRTLDWLAVGTMLLLVLLGLALLFSANYNNSSLWASRFSRQAVAAVIGGFLFFAVLRIPYYRLRRWAATVYGLGVGSLIAVSLMARIIRGSTSRLSLLGVQIQPSEYMKVALVILLAYLITRSVRTDWRRLVLTGLVVVVPVGLVVVEPDLGMAALFLMLWGLLLLWVGLPWRILALLAGMAVIIVGLGWHYLLLEYQKDRIMTFVNPTYDPLGAGYNVTQSIVALGSGRFFGRGLGHGPQSQLQFLPERHTDFVLASLGEELGFVGITVVVALYLVLLGRILHTAHLTNDRFGQALCVGVFIVLLTSFVVSAGMNMGLLPVTGIPLPLISYGGSNLVATCLLLGLVQSVRIHSHWDQAPPRELTHL